MIKAARIDADQCVLDLAAGMGDPTIAIAERIGQSGHVVALDQSPEMLAGARRRAGIDGDVENGSLMAGQSGGMLKEEEPVAAIIEKLMSQSEEALARR